jgi:hypothetical protein
MRRQNKKSARAFIRLETVSQYCPTTVILSLNPVDLPLQSSARLPIITAHHHKQVSKSFAV